MASRSLSWAGSAKELPSSHGHLSEANCSAAISSKASQKERQVRPNESCGTAATWLLAYGFSGQSQVGDWLA